MEDRKGQMSNNEKKKSNEEEMQLIDIQSEKKSESTLPVPVNDPLFVNQRVFKKSLPNNKLTLYLLNRDLIISNGKVDKLLGVVLVDPDYVENKRVYGQINLTFRYGREDEEVMGLKFCTEAIVCFAQLYPRFPGSDHQKAITPLQEALIRRLGGNSHPFCMEVPPVAPPSVHLLPAKEYNGAPIGTSYDVKAYVAERADEKLHRNTTIRMGIRVIQRINLPTNNVYPGDTKGQQQRSTCIVEGENEIIECGSEYPGSHCAVEKPFLLSGGSIRLEAHLDKLIYTHGETIPVHVTVTNYSHKSVKRIQVLVLQHVDVCMFNSGKFKNIVAVETEKDNCPLAPGLTLTETYNVRPTMSSTKNWIALEDNYTKAGTNLASTVVCSGSNDKDKDPFAINVSYYVKVKLLISLMGGVVSIKLPFTLMHRNTEPDLIGFPSPVRDFTKISSNNQDEITQNNKTVKYDDESKSFDGVKCEITNKLDSDLHDETL